MLKTIDQAQLLYKLNLYVYLNGLSPLSKNFQVLQLQDLESNVQASFWKISAPAVLGQEMSRALVLGYTVLQCWIVEMSL